METDLLRTFVLVSEELNFTRAAKRLQLSQPSLSRRIRDLETILDGRLFERGPRKVELTPFGARQLPLAIAVLAQVDEFVDRARGMEGRHNASAWGSQPMPSTNSPSMRFTEGSRRSSPKTRFGGSGPSR